MMIAALAAAAVSAEFVGGKATRDALFLTTLEITALPAMLLGRAAFQFVSAVLVRALAVSDPVTHRAPASNEQSELTLGSSVRVLAAAPHLRSLMTLVLLGTVGAALLDYLFKARAVEAF